MTIQRARFVTNVGKSQITSDDEYFYIKRIPVTVNDAVMNGLLYSAEENRKGMSSIVGRPITLGHPRNASGEHISAKEGEALTEHFSGGHVTDHYEQNNVHYVDAKIKKSTLKSQTGGEWYYNKLEAREKIGVSTGLSCNREPLEGLNADGSKYYAVASKQNYDHLAALHDSEPPAGGKATFMNFNADSTGDIVVNIDEFIDDDESLVERLFNKLAAKFGNDDKTRYNQDAKQTIINSEGDAIMRDFIIQQLAAKGITANAEMTDEQLQAELTKALAANSTPAAPVVDDSVPAWAATLTQNMEDMKKKMSAMEEEKAKTADEAKKKKAKAVAANSAFGLTEEVAFAMNAEALDALYAQCGSINGNAASGFASNADEAEEVF